MSLAKRYKEVGCKALKMAQKGLQGNLSDYNMLFPTLFPTPDGCLKFNNIPVPHPNKEPHKKCCDVCIAARYIPSKMLSVFNMETFYCVHRLVDGKHQPCAAYGAYEKAGKLKKDSTNNKT